MVSSHMTTEKLQPPPAIEARDPDTGEAMDDTQLRDEVMTMFLAGHETTANALAWTVQVYPIAGKENQGGVSEAGLEPA